MFLPTLDNNNMSLSEVSKQPFIFIKCKSVVRVLLLTGFGLMQQISPKMNVKSCKLPPTISTTLSFLQRSSERRIVFCREKQHSLCSRTTFIPLPKCFMHLQCWGRFTSACQFFKRKASSFQISGRIYFSRSARQANQIHFYLYWAWT